MISGFIIGLAASLHCVGMCGPIALALPLNRKNAFTKWMDLIQYGVGKTAAYALLGILIGMLGAGIQLLNWMQTLSIVLGVITIIYGLMKIFKVSYSLGKLGTSLKLSAIMGKFFQSKSPFRLTLIGFANGFLPCGMVILALTNALLIGTPQASVLAMVGFGLGTLPALYAVNILGNKLTHLFKSKWNRVLPYYIVIMGVFIVLRGMDLGIPYISPKNKQVQPTEQNHLTPKQQMGKSKIGYDCCSKPASETPTEN